MKVSFCILVCGISLFLQNGLFAQEPVGAIELPEMNVLYRGYPNRVIPAVTNNGDGRVILLGSNCSVSKSENSDFFTVVPDQNRTTILTLVVDNDGNWDTIRQVQYRVSNLPDPTLYWGGSKSSSKASLHSTNLFAKYPAEVPLNASFSITEWSIFDDGDTISGKGSNLSNADSLFRSFNLPTTLTIKTIVVGPDGIRREIFGQWRVDAWVEQERLPKLLNGCE